jgi:hypothetical protein
MVTAAAGCINQPWWHEELILESEFDLFRDKMIKKHSEECDCGEDLTDRNFTILPD